MATLIRRRLVNLLVAGILVGGGLCFGAATTQPKQTPEQAARSKGFTLEVPPPIRALLPPEWCARVGDRFAKAAKEKLAADKGTAEMAIYTDARQKLYKKVVIAEGPVTQATVEKKGDASVVTLTVAVIVSDRIIVRMFAQTVPIRPEIAAKMEADAKDGLLRLRMSFQMNEFCMGPLSNVIPQGDGRSVLDISNGANAPEAGKGAVIITLKRPASRPAKP